MKQLTMDPLTEKAKHSLPLDNNEVVVKLANGMTLRSGVNDPESEFVLTAGDYVRLCYADGSQRSRWEAAQWEQDPAGVMAAIMVAAANSELALINKEVVVQMADGSTLRSGAYESRCGGPAAGEYVRLCEVDGDECAYWDSSEWAADPALVMGAIINSASGLRIVEA